LEDIEDWGFSEKASFFFFVVLPVLHVFPVLVLLFVLVPPLKI
jgi:hypothetical protein